MSTTSDKIAAKPYAWEAKIKFLEAKTGDTESAIRLQVASDIDAMHENQRTAKKKLKQIKNTTSETWGQVKGAADKAWGGLKTGVAKARSSFTS